MVKEKELSIQSLLEKGEEATDYNRVTRELQEEEAIKLTCIPKQAENWNALTNQVVGANSL